MQCLRSRKAAQINVHNTCAIFVEQACAKHSGRESSVSSEKGVARDGLGIPIVEQSVGSRCNLQYFQFGDGALQVCACPGVSVCSCVVNSIWHLRH